MPTGVLHSASASWPSSWKELGVDRARSSEKAEGRHDHDAQRYRSAESDTAVADRSGNRSSGDTGKDASNKADDNPNKDRQRD
jgi:hypothetical protein